MRAEKGQTEPAFAGRFGRIARLCALCASLWLGAGLLAAPMAWAQPAADQFVEDPLLAPGAEGAPEGAAPAGTGREFTRMEVLHLSYMAYKKHPFLQITGDSDFAEGKAGSGSTSLETPATAAEENILLKGLHSLPPFSIETGTTLDLPIPKAISIGFDYTRISQLDKDAVDTDKAVIEIPRIQMDTYYYIGFVRAYAFDTSEPGINYYLGAGVGILDGKFNSIPFLSASQETISFGQTPIGVQQLGLEVMGDNFGFRYEVRIVNARKVKLDKNPYLGQSAVTEINFSGTMTRLSMLYQF